MPTDIIENEEVKEQKAIRDEKMSKLNKKATLVNTKKSELHTQGSEYTIQDAKISDPHEPTHMDDTKALLHETNQRLKSKMIELVKTLEIVQAERDQYLRGQPEQDNQDTKKL